MQRLLLAAVFAAMFIAMSSAPTRTKLCLGCLKFASAERCCRVGPSSARKQHGEQHNSGSACPSPRLRSRCAERDLERGKRALARLLAFLTPCLTVYE